MVTDLCYHLSYDSRGVSYFSVATDFSNQGGISQKKERVDLRLSSAVPKVQWECNHGYKAMGNLYLYKYELHFFLHF